MATRYIGNAKLAVTYDDRAGQYKVAISARGKHLSTQYVRPPNAHRGYGVDNPKAYDEAASAAASFEVHEGGPASDALESGYAMSGTGWNVRRSATRKNAPRARKPSRPTKRPSRSNAPKVTHTIPPLEKWDMFHSLEKKHDYKFNVPRTPYEAEAGPTAGIEYSINALQSDNGRFAGYRLTNWGFHHGHVGINPDGSTTSWMFAELFRDPRAAVKAARIHFDQHAASRKNAPRQKATRKSARKASRSNRPRKVARKVGARRKARAAGR